MTSFKSVQVAFLIICTLGFGAYALSKYHIEERENHDQVIELAEGYLKQSHPLAALQVLNENKNFLQNPLYEGTWKKLALQSVEILQDDAMLTELWTLDPDLFKDREDLSIRIGSYLLAAQDLDHYDFLANSWIKKGNSPDWLLLEADALAFKGKPDQAIELLEVAPLKGNYEISRLIRLALLNGKEHPKIAWSYLNQALKINPNLSDLHLYRAQILEGSNHLELAVKEYKEAIAKNSLDPFYREELIDFYLRQRNFQEAHDALQATLKTSPSDKLWLKAVFLNKVYQPSKLNLANESLPSGTTTPFLRYLLAIPPTEFWNDSLLSSQKTVETLSSQIPEAQWLKVFEFLKIGSEALALETLNNYPEMVNLNPLLYHGLKKAIVFHLPYLKTVEPPEPKLASTIHPVFNMLFNPNASKEYKTLFISNEIYPALTLASGWYEAALNLKGWHANLSSTYQEIPSEFPRWVAYGYAKALINNRSNEEAINFINEQFSTPQLALLGGELNFKLGNYQESEVTLLPISKNSGPLGVKAALLLSKNYEKNGQFEKAREAIIQNDELKQSLAGKELLARLELEYGDKNKAESLYAMLQDSSLEAKSYFAKKYFNEGDYKTAYKLTRALLEEFPNQPSLIAQLNQIKNAAETKKNQK